MGYFAHEQALVESKKVGDRTSIWAFTHVQEGASVGSNCNIGEHCFVEGGAVIGDNVTIKNNIAVWDGVTLETSAFVGPGVIFTNDLRPRSPRMAGAPDRYKDRSWLTRTLVREGATIGAGATVLSDLTIGRFAMVGAGAVITRSVPDFGLVHGNPARLVGHVCRCGQRLEFKSRKATCGACQRAFEQSGDGVVTETSATSSADSPGSP